jgi:hypothetical protein
VWGDNNCGHSEDAGVRCGTKGENDLRKYLKFHSMNSSY